jgi:phage shock protein PspC (stress-responsive transcriptional regulator)
MTEAPPTVDEPAAGPEPKRVLSRGGPGRMLTGVCAGLGRYTGMDPVLFRVGFAVLVLASGIGFMLYVAAYLLMREPTGGAGHLERWTHRMFDAETVLALMAAVFAFGLIINVASGGISTGTIVVGTLLAIVLLAAHARGVDLLTMAKSVPDRAIGRRGMTRTSPFATAQASYTGAPQTPSAAPYGRPPADDAAPGGPDGAEGAPGSSAGSAAAEQAKTAEHTKISEAPEPASPEAPPVGSATSPTPPGPAAPPTTGGYRRLSDLAREARAGTYGYASGEPFAPHGPYTVREPYPPEGPPPVPSPPPAPPKRVKAKRPKSFVGGLTLWLALIVGGVMAAVQQSGTGSINPPMVGGAILVTIGAGLLVATWFGRGAGLVVAGIFVSLVLVAGSTVNGIPKKIGSFVWRPVSVSQASQDYMLGMGEGKLDLSDIALSPGTRVRFNASVSVGQLTVIVPPNARIEVHGYTRLGEVRIDYKVEDGADVQFDRVLEPEVAGTGDAPTIELHVKAGVGDVDVRRGA